MINHPQSSISDPQKKSLGCRWIAAKNPPSPPSVRPVMKLFSKSSRRWKNSRLLSWPLLAKEIYEDLDCLVTFVIHSYLWLSMVIYSCLLLSIVVYCSIDLLLSIVTLVIYCYHCYSSYYSYFSHYFFYWRTQVSLFFLTQFVLFSQYS